MSIDNRLDNRKHKTIDAVNYNGKYVDPSVVRKKILSVTAGIAAIICFVVIIIL